MARERLRPEDYLRVPNTIRDTQRRGVYASDYEIAKELISLGMTHPLNDMEAMEYFDSIVSSRWWGNRLEELGLFRDIRPTMQLHNGRGSYAKCSRERPFCKISREQLKSMGAVIILHELAHLISPSRKVRIHGREFVKAYLDIMERFLCKEASDILRGIFKKNNVRVRGTDREFYARQYKRNYERKNKKEGSNVLHA